MSALQVLLDTLEQDGSLNEPEQLRRRIDALDHLEMYLICGQRQEGSAESAAELALRHRAERMCADLEAINRELYRSIRHKIRQGSGSDWLFEWANASNEAGPALDQINGVCYDHLDVLVSGIFQFEEPAEGIAEWNPEMVRYQPTPARHIFELINLAALNEKDVLIDLGSGLGHVSLLAAMSTEARCIGIEWEAAHVACAQQCARELNVRNVSFIQQDARLADFSEGTVFYLYTPFTGSILQDVLERLRQEAIKRPIRVCTLGPCTSVVANEAWLSTTGSPDADRIAVFSSTQR